MTPKNKSVPQSKGSKAKQTRSESPERIPAGSWQDFDLRVKAIHITLSSPAELLKGNGLVLLQNLSDSITSLAADAPQPADKPHVASCSSGLLHLLAELLSARKRPRDWKQASYCGSVTAVLAASTAVQRLEGRMHWGVDPMKPSDIISRIAAALDDITQLLSSQSDALQRPTQQQPAAQTPQIQHQQKQQQQLQHLACELLHWCSTRFVLNSMETHGGTSLQLRAVELAAVLAHSLTNQEPTTMQDALPYVVIYDLLDRLLYPLVHLVHKDISKGALIFVELHKSPAFMQLSLLLLLQLQIHTMNLDQVRSTNSSSSSSHCDDGTAAAPAVAPAAAASACSSSSLNSSADPAAAQQTQQQQQQQPANTHQAYALMQQLWRAAGFAPEAMHGNWQRALQTTLEDEGLLPLTLKAAGLQGLAAASKQQHSSKGKTISSMSFYETLPGAPDNLMQAFVILTQALGKCVGQCSCDKGFGLDTCYENCIEKLQHSKHPSRQQQQLLQAVVWPLPLFLLQTAAQPYGYVFGCALELVDKVARAQANSLLLVSRSEARAALAPWLGLMGSYLREAALAVQQQRGGAVAVLNPDHAEAAAAGQAAAAAAEGSVDEKLTLALRNCDQALDQVLELLKLLEEFLADTWHDRILEDDHSSSSSSSGSSSGGAGADDDNGADSSVSGGTGSGGDVACSSSGGSSGDAAAGSSWSMAVNAGSSRRTVAGTIGGSGSTSTAVNATPSSSSSGSSSSSSSSDGDSGEDGSKLETLWEAWWRPAVNSSSKGKEGGEGLSDLQPVGDQDKQQQQQQQQQQENDTAGTAAAAAAGAAERSCTPYSGLGAELDALGDMQDVRDLRESLMWDIIVDDVAQGGPGITTECEALSYFLDDDCFDELADQAQFLSMEVCRKVPMPWCCNNPDCVNMGGVSELQLVGAKSCVCAGCKVARYCSRSCQAAHWAAHKSVCQQFQY